MEVNDNICQHRDNRKIGIGTYLDFQKAFDTIIHSNLLEKVDIYGFHNK